MFKNTLFKMSIIVGILFVSAILVHSHSGRTDKYGGHHDRVNGGYHFHNSGTVSKPRTTLSEGSKPYTPTRLEWLAVKLNAEYSSREYRDDGALAISVSPTHQKNTLTITVIYGGGFTLNDVNNSIKFIKKSIEMHAEYYDWGSWLKIETNIKRIPNP